MSLGGCRLSSWKGHGSGELPICWRKANFTSVVRKGKKKEDLGNYGLHSFTSGPG